MSLTLIILCAAIGLTSGAGVLPNDSINAAVGSSVTFNTSLAPVQSHLPSVLWQFGSIAIVNSLSAAVLTDPAYKDRVILSTLTGSLELRNVGLSDKGLYRVTIRPTAADPTTEGNTTLNIYERVSNVEVRVTNTDLVEFNSVSLSCSASASLSFLWFSGSAEVTAGDRVQINDGGATLTINPVLRYDQGSYSCEAYNPVSSSKSDNITLSVSYGPENVILTHPPLDEYYEGGSVISLNCSADSRPDAQFQWLLDEETLTSYAGPQIKLVLEQSGNYSCRAFNSKTGNSTDSQPVELLVRDSIQVPGEVKIYGGATLKLKCSAYPAAGVQYSWMKDGKFILGGIGGSHLEYTKKTGAFSTSDSGNYTCAAYNPVTSKVLEASCQVTVSVNPGIIVGIVIACIAAVLLILGGAFYGLKKKKEKKQKNNGFQMEHVYENTSHTGNADEEDKHIYMNASPYIYDRKM